MRPRDAQILYANPYFARMLGYRRGELVGKNAVVLNAPSPMGTPQEVDSKIRKSLESSGSWEGEVHNITKRGRVLTCRSKVSTVNLAGLGTVWLAIHEDITARKKAEDALQSNHALLQSFCDSSPFMMGVAELDGNRTVAVYCNRTVGSFLGRRSGDLPGRTGLELGNSAEFERLLVRSYRRSQREGRPVQFEHSVPRRGGTSWLRGWVMFIGMGTTGNPQFSFTFEDVTDLKHKEVELRRSEAELAESQRVTKTGSWSFDILSGRVWWSDELHRVFEVGKKAFGGLFQSFLDRVHPEDRPKMLVIVAQARATGRPYEIEYRIVLRGGRIKWARSIGYASKDARGEVVRLFGTAQDITDRKLAQSRLESSEARFRAIFDQSPVPLLELDMSGSRQYMDSLRRRGVKDLRRYLSKHPDAARTLAARSILAANEAALRLSGVESLTKLKTHCDTLASENARILAEVPIVLAEVNPHGEIPLSVRSATGKSVEVVLRYHALPGHEKTLDQVILAIVDVTAIREAQHALEAAHRKLLHATEAEQRRIARELHDSVAQRAVGLQLVLKDLEGRLTRSGIADAKFLQAANEQCTRIVQELREICYGLYPQTLERFGLHSALRQLADIPSSAGLQTEVLVTPDAARLRFDPDVEIAIYRIAQEAVSNALRHGNASCMSVHLYTDPTRKTLVLAVTDNGKGFAKERRSAGGIGLVSMRERAEAVKGELTIDSRPGGGTTVFLGVPVDGPPAGS